MRGWSTPAGLLLETGELVQVAPEGCVLFQGGEDGRQIPPDVVARNEAWAVDQVTES